MRLLQNKKVLISSANSAIVQNIASRFSENGASVSVIAEKNDDIKSLGNIYGNDIMIFRENEDSSVLMSEIFREAGKIDILINYFDQKINFCDRQPMHLFDNKIYEENYRNNLDKVYHFSRSIIPSMVEANEGNIINISSILGLVPAKGQSPYVAAKSGLIAISKAWALELAPYNIRVNSMAIGLVEGDERAAENNIGDLLSYVPLNRVGTPADIANAALFLASDLSAYVTGECLKVDGGFNCSYARNF